MPKYTEDQWKKWFNDKVEYAAQLWWEMQYKHYPQRMYLFFKSGDVTVGPENMERGPEWEMVQPSIPMNTIDHVRRFIREKLRSAPILPYNEKGEWTG